MTMNKGKGGKSRKKRTNKAPDDKRELLFEDGQEYAQVTRMLGDSRCEALCIDKTTRLCHIRGKMHKEAWVLPGDIILVSLRDYQDHKLDVVHKYRPDEARRLKGCQELPENVRLNEGVTASDAGSDEDGGGGSEYLQFQDEDFDRL